MYSKTIPVLVGSGMKNGNTDKLADAFMQGASAAGHSVTKVFLGDKVTNGCRRCNGCRFGKPCIENDDMQEIYPLQHASDTVVLASPLYYWTITARTKAFLERLYAPAMEDENPPKGRYERYHKKDTALLHDSGG